MKRYNSDVFYKWQRNYSGLLIREMRYKNQVIIIIMKKNPLFDA